MIKAPGERLALRLELERVHNPVLKAELLKDRGQALQEERMHGASAA